jgi:superfamily II DNA or RNA helicase
VTLSGRAYHLFPADVRQRGHAFYTAGKVAIHTGSSTGVDATVVDGRVHDVSLVDEDGDLAVACDCKLHGETGVCEHVWATLLSAEGSSYLKRIKRGRGALTILGEDLEPVGEPDDDEDEENDEDEDDENEEDDEDETHGRLEEWAWPMPAARRALRSPGPQIKPKPRGPAKPRATDWQRVLPTLRAEPPPPAAVPKEEGLFYLLDRDALRSRRAFEIEVARPKKSAKKGTSPFARVSVTEAAMESAPNPEDRAILAALRGAAASYAYNYGYSQSYGYRSGDASRFSLQRAARDLLAPLLARSGRLRLRDGEGDPEPETIRWDEGEPWQLRLRASAVGGASPTSDTDWELVGVLRRGDEEAPLTEPDAIFDEGLMVLRGSLSRLDDGGAASWRDLLRQHGRFRIGAAHRRAFIEEIYALARVPPLDLPEGWAVPEEAPSPSPRLHIRPGDEARGGSRSVLFADLALDYDRLIVRASRYGKIAFDPERRRVVRRDPEAEAKARARLGELDLRPIAPANRRAAPDGADLQIHVSRLPAAVRALVAEGWHVEASGKLYRKPGSFKIGVASGVDWFELHAKVDFEGASLDIARLAEALRKGESTVVLDDGSLGLVPEEWLARYGLLAEVGTVEDGHLRFKKSQVGLLDAMLASQPEVDVDAVFARARDELARSAKIVPVDPPKTFHGALRAYQREGLGWLLFLDRTGFGGCLADDMGLGKTVQVLALLTELRKPKGRGKKPTPRKPTLVVAPRSVIFNWREEAARFAPDLRVLEHTGTERAARLPSFADHDVILTTYGILRRDALELAQVELDYAILDEAQAIKNDRSETAKAARLLRADHRLALSGTPIENHLGELWSLFEFLNPGMLGRASAFRAVAEIQGGPSPETIALLSRALRPFIVRRTKSQVAKDLPDRTEETVMIDLEGAQKKLYDELRAHYRAVLQKKVQERGLERSKIHVLEALLRLRQVACHPALVDPKRRGDPSAKLDVLLEELPILREKGQKALVFSQFTSLLAIVREELDARRIPYEYLDGATVDRQARVERFQTDPGCPFFLISLKAGGLGLNLTAAEYVFLLDPWWNPAAEAQAIDRAHRIGQTRPVFAYRLLARGTIEERILELAQRKKKLADSVIEADGSLIGDLTAEDLDLLLS